MTQTSAIYQDQSEAKLSISDLCLTPYIRCSCRCYYWSFYSELKGVGLHSFVILAPLKAVLRTFVLQISGFEVVFRGHVI